MDKPRAAEPTNAAGAGGGPKKEIGAGWSRKNIVDTGTTGRK